MDHTELSLCARHCCKRLTSLHPPLFTWGGGREEEQFFLPVKFCLINAEGIREIEDCHWANTAIIIVADETQ